MKDLSGELQRIARRQKTGQALSDHMVQAAVVLSHREPLRAWDLVDVHGKLYHNPI
ncbi:MAG TPA: hypothetical protein VFJ47_11710 [Terriglobales bacterium]|nr:hypothetical protein [Terriglobales bacterium]